MRRRLLQAAGGTCLLVAAALVAHAAIDPGGTVLAAAAIALAGAVHGAWLARKDDGAAHAALRIDARGRIEVRAGASAAAVSVLPVAVGTRRVVLESAAGARTTVWMDCLPRAGFRRLLVACRWAAADIGH